MEPAGCWTLTWQAVRVSDSRDLVATNVNLFSIDATELTMLALGENYTRRKTLNNYDMDDLTFIGTVNSNPAVTTSSFAFKIDTTDECRSANIVA